MKFKYFIFIIASIHSIIYTMENSADSKKLEQFSSNSESILVPKITRSIATHIDSLETVITFHKRTKSIAEWLNDHNKNHHFGDTPIIRMKKQLNECPCVEQTGRLIDGFYFIHDDNVKTTNTSSIRRTIKQMNAIYVSNTSKKYTSKKWISYGTIVLCENLQYNFDPTQAMYDNNTKKYPQDKFQKYIIKIKDRLVTYLLDRQQSTLIYRINPRSVKHICSLCEPITFNTQTRSIYEWLSDYKEHYFGDTPIISMEQKTDGELCFTHHGNIKHNNTLPLCIAVHIGCLVYVSHILRKYTRPKKYISHGVMLLVNNNSIPNFIDHFLAYIKTQHISESNNEYPLTIA